MLRISGLTSLRFKVGEDLASQRCQVVVAVFVGACFEAAADEVGLEEFFEVEGEAAFFQAEGFLDFGEAKVGAFAEEDEDGLAGWVVQRCDESAGLGWESVFFYGSHRFMGVEQV